MSEAIHLTIGEKILLHLLNNMEHEEELVVSQEATQHGISTGLGIRQSHVSYDVNILEGKKLLTSSVKHVRHLKRRRKAYFLTQQGYRQAKSIRSKASEIKVKVLDAGRERTMTLDAISRKHGYTLIRLLEACEDSGILDMSDFGERSQRRESDDAIVELIGCLVKAGDVEEATETLLNTRHLLRTAHCRTIIDFTDELIIPGLATRTNLELQLIKAEANIFLGSWDEANRLLQEVVHSSFSDTSLYAEAAYLLGVISYRTGNFDEAISKLIEAHAAADRSGSIVLPNINNLLGILAWEKGDFESALNFYNKALEQFKSFNDLNGIAKAYTNIGILMQENKKLDLALDNYSSCLKLAEKLNDSKTMASIYANLGDVYKEKKMPDQALDYYNKSLDTARTIDFQWQVANALYNIALLSNGTERDRMLAQSTEIFKKLGAQKDVEKINNILE